MNRRSAINCRRQPGGVQSADRVVMVLRRRVGAPQISEALPRPNSAALVPAVNCRCADEPSHATRRRITHACYQSSHRSSSSSYGHSPMPIAASRYSRYACLLENPSKLVSSHSSFGCRSSLVSANSRPKQILGRFRWVPLVATNLSLPAIFPRGIFLRARLGLIQPRAAEHQDSRSP